MKRSETNPDDAAAGSGAAESRYRAGSESVLVTQHEGPGHGVYGPESAEAETIDSAAERDDEAEPTAPLR